MPSTLMAFFISSIVQYSILRQLGWRWPHTSRYVSQQKTPDPHHHRELIPSSICRRPNLTVDTLESEAVPNTSHTRKPYPTRSVKISAFILFQVPNMMQTAHAIYTWRPHGGVEAARCVLERRRQRSKAAVS